MIARANLHRSFSHRCGQHLDGLNFSPKEKVKARCGAAHCAGLFFGPTTEPQRPAALKAHHSSEARDGLIVSALDPERQRPNRKADHWKGAAEGFINTPPRARARDARLKTSSPRNRKGRFGPTGSAMLRLQSKLP
jgi:hypothetical protein